MRLPHVGTHAHTRTIDTRAAQASGLLADVTVRVWLSRKLADVVNGIDLKGRQVGDVLELCTREAALLLADGFAEFDRRVTGDRRAAGREARDRRRTAAPHTAVCPTDAG